MELKYLGDFSAVDPAYSRNMSCYDCKVTWTGCWDNFQCPICDKGELPSSDLDSLMLPIKASNRSTEAEARYEERKDCDNYINANQAVGERPAQINGGCQPPPNNKDHND